MSSSSSERSRRSSEGRQQKNGHVNGFEASQEFKHANGGRDGMNHSAGAETKDIRQGGSGVDLRVVLIYSH